MKGINASIKSRDGEPIDSMLKRFNTQVQNSNIFQDIKDKEYYLKPSARRRFRILQNKMKGS